MSDDSFDPAVVTLLREIAADPRASLLRIPKERLIRWVGRPEEVIKPSGSYLTKAEKHLVKAYREEAAWVLLQACVVELKKQPLVVSTLAPDPMRLKQAAESLSAAKSLPPVARRATRDLASGLALDAVQLGATALRLVPTDHARNCLAVAFQREGRDASSLPLLHRLLAGEPCAVQRAQAFENMARIWTRRADHSKALTWSREASRADEQRVRFLVWCLTSAIQAGDERSTRAQAIKIEEHARREEVVGIAQSLTAARLASDWVPTLESQRLVARLSGEMPEIAWKVCNAFA